ncbi:MAG: hypothetical protein RL094_814 [Candidatus Parcubacteria bacterium]|jgi:hypothetical protein
MNQIRKTVAGLLIAFLALQFVPLQALAIVASDITVTPATGGDAIPATIGAGVFTTISGPALLENGPNGIKQSTIGNDKYITLTAPAGFVFATTSNSVTADVTVGGGSCATAILNNDLVRLGTSLSLNPYASNPNFHQTVTPTASTVQVRVLEASEGSCRSKVTFSGIKVLPTSTTTPYAVGNIAVGGAALQGRSLSTHGGTLKVVSGPATQISMVATPNLVEAASSTSGANIEFTVKDTFGNPVTDGTAVTVASTMGTFTGSGNTVDGKFTRTLKSNTVGVATVSADPLTFTGTTTITFQDTTAPVIHVNGDVNTQVFIDSTYTDAGATSSDAVDGDLTSSIVTTGTVNTASIGTYTITYTVQDAVHHETVATRDVHVVSSTTPVITLVGDNPVTVQAGTVYTDAGATAEDAPGHSVTVLTSSNVMTTATGTYAVTYTAGNEMGTTTKTRTVTVVDTSAPVITLNGSSVIDLTINSPYVEEGATITDNLDKDVPVVTTGSVNVAVAGEYTVHYNATDSSGNVATEVTRLVRVRPIGTDASLSALSAGGFTFSPVFVSGSTTPNMFVVILPKDATTTPTVAATTTDSRATSTIVQPISPFATTTVTVSESGTTTTSIYVVASSTVHVVAEDGDYTSDYFISFVLATNTPATTTPPVNNGGSSVAPQSGASGNNGSGSSFGSSGVLGTSTAATSTGTTTSPRGGTNDSNGEFILGGNTGTENTGSSKGTSLTTIGSGTTSTSSTGFMTASTTTSGNDDQGAAVGNAGVMKTIGWILGILALLILIYTGYRYSKDNRPAGQ